MLPVPFSASTLLTGRQEGRPSISSPKVLPKGSLLKKRREKPKGTGYI